MKSTKKLIFAVVTALTIVGTSASVFAASRSNVATKFTAKTVTQVAATSTLASKLNVALETDAERLAEYHKTRLAVAKEILDARVADGRITQEQADETYTLMETNQALCDGTGTSANCGSGGCSNGYVAQTRGGCGGGGCGSGVRY